MERDARAGDLAAAMTRLPDLESRFARLSDAMEDFVGEKKPGPGEHP